MVIDATDSLLQDKIREHCLYGQAICVALNDELDKVGLPSHPSIPEFESAEFMLEKDPSTVEYALIGVWRDAHGHKVGQVIIHVDSSFYAEYDVVKPHPVKRRWFIEAITAWGNREVMKAEAKLLPILS